MFPIPNVKAWANGAVAVSVLIGLVWASMALRNNGYEACESKHQVANAIETTAIHEDFLAGVLWGDKLSANLLQTERELNDEATQYQFLANRITGKCDSSVRLLVEHASGTKAKLPEASSTPITEATPESALDRAYEEAVARAIGENIAINYSRFDKCIAEYTALIAFHDRPKEALINE